MVLIGAAGAGKTTLVRRLFEPDEILSSDELRGVVSGDPTDQRATRTAFSILHRGALRRLTAGRLVVVDATNVQRHARAGLLRRAALARSPAIALVLALPPALVRARNSTRQAGIVPVAAVEAQLAAAAELGGERGAIVATLRGEGFAAVHVLETSDELDLVAVVREPRRTWRATPVASRRRPREPG